MTYFGQSVVVEGLVGEEKIVPLKTKQRIRFSRQQHHSTEASHPVGVAGSLQAGIVFHFVAVLARREFFTSLPSACNMYFLTSLTWGFCSG